MLSALLCLAAFTHHSVYKITLIIPDFLCVSLLPENPLREHSPKKDAQPFEEICGQRVLPQAGGIALCGVCWHMVLPLSSWSFGTVASSS